MTFVLKKMETKTEIKGGPTRRKSTTKCEKLCAKEERNASFKKVSIVLQKSEEERTLEEQQMLNDYSEIVADLKSRWQRRDELKKRMEEWEEPMEVLQEKALALAQAILQSEHLVIYTGAGISTAARIPDYRGSNGIWTRLQQGKEIGNHDLSLAEPTYTHMALSELYSKKILKYIVSQNCDGLHLRSGLPRTAVSELHGNMYIEVCKNCKPAREYWRLFDVTENTARFSHKTMRRCYICSKELVDTIVHFGERGTLQWPLNWKGACNNADKADTIICLGSSLKVLKRYPWLWQMSKPAKKRPNLYIVNLQWTPKDEYAALKLNGKCDVVMKMVMKNLGIEVPQYQRENDPIFAHATMLLEEETHTTTQPNLKEDLESDVFENKNENQSSIKTNSVEDEIKSEDTIKKEVETKVREELSEDKSLNLIEGQPKYNGHPNSKEEIDAKLTEEGLKTEAIQEFICEPKLKEEIKSENSENANLTEDLKAKINSKGEINEGIDLKEESKLKGDWLEEEIKTEHCENKKLKQEILETKVDISDKEIVSASVKSVETKSEELSYVEDQTEAIDYSKQKTNTLNVRNNCDINTHSSIKTSRLTLNGSRNCTLSETLAVNKRKTQTLSPPSKPSNIFSIDNILSKNPSQKTYSEQNRTVINPVQNFQTLMAYYELANTVLQNQMLGYVTSNLYPMQTSLLYPGFHSIINPVPYINYEFNTMPTNFQPSVNKIQMEIKKEPEIPKEPSCNFCFKHFQSYSCLYYSSIEPKFVKELFRFSKAKNCNTLLVCICCDYTTEEDESSDDESKNKKKTKKIEDENDESDSIKENETKESLCENIDQTNIENNDNKISKIRAGWFGKGYRKNRRIKKR